MELRKDPITQSWVILGQREARGEAPEECPLEPAKIEKLRSIMTWPTEGAWQVRVLPHPDPLYHIEGEPGRVAEGMYDKMVALGAHEVVVETPLHDKRMTQFSDEEIERVLWVWASRIADLKKDARFKYISVFKNQEARQAHRGRAGSLLRAVPVCVAGAVRNMAAAPAAQPFIRATAAWFESQGVGGAPGARIAPAGESGGGISSGGAHVPQYKEQEG